MRKNLSVSPVNVVCFIAEAVACPFVFVWVIFFPLFDCLAPVGQSVLNGFAEQRTLAFVVVVVDDYNLCFSAVVHTEIYVTVVGVDSTCCASCVLRAVGVALLVDCFDHGFIALIYQLLKVLYLWFPFVLAHCSHAPHARWLCQTVADISLRRL